MENFDQLSVTPAEQEALARLREATGETDGPMERHSLRTRHIGAKLAGQRGWMIDGEVLTVAAILHDAGLYPGISRGGVYTSDGAQAASELLAAHGWSPERITLCADAIDRHHEIRNQRARGAEVEALRLADLVELSGGLLRFGLDRAWLRELYAAVPRKGLVGELAREVGKAFKERPLTMPRIFWRG